MQTATPVAAQVVAQTAQPSRSFSSTSKGRLQIKNLSFQYGPEEPWVLKNINLNVEPSQSVAIVGRTGSGKSTLISLLQKNYPLHKGDILLDGQSIKEIPIQELRKQLSLIRQDDFIFSGSILSNITLEDPSISIDKVYEVLAEIGYLQLLRKSHRNIHFILREGGKNISVGEQQLIALARIFVNEPQVVLLDEANAHIDFKCEHLLQNLIQKICKKHTCLMISHKIHDMAQWGTVVTLSQGEIIKKESSLKPQPQDTLSASLAKEKEAQTLQGGKGCQAPYSMFENR